VTVTLEIRVCDDGDNDDSHSLSDYEGIINYTENELKLYKQAIEVNNSITLRQNVKLL